MGRPRLLDPELRRLLDPELRLLPVVRHQLRSGRHDEPEPAPRSHADGLPRGRLGGREAEDDDGEEDALRDVEEEEEQLLLITGTQYAERPFPLKISSASRSDAKQALSVLVGVPSVNKRGCFK